MPGAYTPGCSKTHLPGYIEQADEIKCEQGVDEIICISVNDPFVMYVIMMSIDLLLMLTDFLI